MNDFWAVDTEDRARTYIDVRATCASYTHVVAGINCRVGHGTNLSRLFPVPSTVYCSSKLPSRSAFSTRKCCCCFDVRAGPTVVLGVALKLEDNSSVFRLGGAVDEYSIQRRPRNMETNVSFIQ